VEGLYVATAWTSPRRALLGMAIGRIGDLINGEHLRARPTCVGRQLYPPELARLRPLGHVARTSGDDERDAGRFHNLGCLLWLISGPFKRRPGMAFFAFLNTYAVMRFLVSYLRVDSAGTVLTDVTVPQLVSLVVVVLSSPVAALFWRRGPIDRAPAEAASPAGRVQVRRTPAVATASPRPGCPLLAPRRHSGRRKADALTRWAARSLRPALVNIESDPDLEKRFC